MVFCISISFLLSGCKKIMEGDIVGTWKSVDLVHPQASSEIIWEFTKENNFIVTVKNKNSNISTTYFRSRYSVIWEGSKTVAKISGNDSYYSRSWIIKDMNEDILVLFNNDKGNYSLEEFSKIK
ncbi:MAG: hypothetical protein Q8880_00270 [Bacteroidota bacterium]|nr:hypothetical protein [Bacteroidota bacterium]